MDQSKNPFLKYLRDTANKHISSFDNDEKKIQYAVTRGKDMEKRIRSIIQTLKNITTPRTTELQSELEEIEKHAATELKKLKEMENAEDIITMKTKFNEKYTYFQEQCGIISQSVLTMLSKNEETQKAEYETAVADAKTKLINLIQTFVPILRNTQKDTDAISNKMRTTYNAFSSILDDLIKVEKMEYHLLIAQKKLKKMPLLQFVHHWYCFVVQ